MKKIFLLTSILFISLTFVCGQEEKETEMKTVFRKGSTTIGGFGGMMMHVTLFEGHPNFMMGGGGGIMLNHYFYFGGYGMGNTTPSQIAKSDYAVLELEDNEEYILNFGYGGLYTGLVLGWKSPVHFNFGIGYGWGALTVNNSNFNTDYNVISDNLLVILPFAKVELNMTKFFRIAMGGNYRWVNGVELQGYKNSSFSSPSFQVDFMFGAF